MEAYVVTATPEQGVCMVKGVGVDHAGDAYGYKIIDVAADLRRQISVTYGSSRLNDFLESGSIWRESNDWAMAILKHERSYQFVWNRSAGSTLPNNVVEILETVGATSPGSTYLTLQFKYSNYSACQAEIDKVSAKNF